MCIKSKGACVCETVHLYGNCAPCNCASPGILVEKIKATHYDTSGVKKRGKEVNAWENPFSRNRDEICAWKCSGRVASALALRSF